MTLKYLLPFIMILNLAVAYAEPNSQHLYIETIYHRPALELVPLIKPFLSQQGKIKHLDASLIIRTDYKNYIQIKQLIRQFDQPPRKIRISLRQSSAQTVSDDMAADSRDTIINSESRRRNATVKMLITRENTPAYFNNSFSFPVASQVSSSHSPQLSQQTIHYHTIKSGFYVLATLHGDTVTIAITTSKASLHPQAGGRYSSQASQTRLTGPLDKWLLISGHNNSTTNHSSRHVISTKSRKHNHINTYIKIEALEPGTP